MIYYRYSLKKGSKHEKCPNCGKKSFKRYVDTQTGQDAGEKYGRCEKINSCGYILYPKLDKDAKYEPKTHEFAPLKPVEYVPIEIVEATFNEYRSNIFFQYLRTTFGAIVATELIEKYNIGTAKHGGTIFWQEDRQGRFRTGKVMYYTPNGKRDKERKSWFTHSKIKPDFNYQQCFFGLHLVSAEKPVALCESEKTAVMMSVYQPEYTWIASGGSEMINVQRLMELPRLDKVFADNGQFEKWAQKTKIFDTRQMDVTVDLAVDSGILEIGSDILDLIQTKL